jgi:hypothetical protein
MAYILAVLGLLIFALVTGHTVDLIFIHIGGK